MTFNCVRVSPCFNSKEASKITFESRRVEFEKLSGPRTEYFRGIVQKSFKSQSLFYIPRYDIQITPPGEYINIMIT
eukprot:g63036.t1